MKFRSLAAAAFAATLTLSLSTANAAPFLTAAATSAGFTLTTFVDGFSSNPGGVGPVGILRTPSGVLVTDYYPGYTKTFADVDGQHNGSVAPTQYYGTNNPTGLTSVFGKYYMTEQQTGKVVEITSTGAYVRDVVTIAGATGIAANPASGHLYVSTGGAIYDVNPLANSFTPFAGTAANFDQADGLSVSSDGSTVYAAICCGGDYNQQIVGFDTTTQAVVFNSGVIAGGIDGNALGSGSLAGNIFVNTNGGTFVEVNMLTKLQTVLFTGGSRGDFVAVDTSNGSLLITQSNSIVRLTAPSGGGFGDTVPAPASLALLGLGLIGIGGLRRKLNAA